MVFDTRAAYQAAIVSLASAGLNVLKFGNDLSIASCSIGSCVGPSSPTPIESCVNTNIVGIFISAESLAIGFV